MITVSAPGKLMIMGEHAVLYGHPCIVTAVDERLTVTADHLSDGHITVDTGKETDTRFVDAAIAKFFATKGIHIKDRGVSLTTRSAFTSQIGFGSSSAVSVATIKALSILFGVPFSQRDVFDMAYAAMLDVQGLGSGFDVAAATYGGTIYFVAGGKMIEPLALDAMPLVVGYTGVKASTTALVHQVAEKKEHNPEKVGRIFQAIAGLVDKAKVQILEGDWERVGKFMDFNQEYLRDLGVSSQKLEDLIGAAHESGAWGAKLSGAGGGDCMIALVPPEKREVVIAAITAAGGQVMPVHAHAEGVNEVSVLRKNTL